MIYEKGDNMMVNKSAIINIIIVVLIITTLYLSGCSDSNEKENDDEIKEGEFVDAKRFKKDADENAKKWKSDAYLLEVESISTSFNEGKSQFWRFVYYSPSTVKEMADGSSDEYDFFYYSIGSKPPIKEDILIQTLSRYSKNLTQELDWIIKSDEAYSIANSSTKAINFQKEHKDFNVGQTIRIDSNDREHFPGWIIWWRDNDSNDELFVYVNANTGELYHV